MAADVTLPGGTAPLPGLVVLPKPVDPTTPCGATAGPRLSPYGLPIEATVAGRVELGFGVAPKVSPRCTGAVEGFCRLFCAGMAAVSAALGCGANVTVCGRGWITGIFTFASICT